MPGSNGFSQDPLLESKEQLDKPFEQKFPALEVPKLENSNSDFIKQLHSSILPSDTKVNTDNQGMNQQALHLQLQIGDDKNISNFNQFTLNTMNNVNNMMGKLRLNTLQFNFAPQPVTSLQIIDSLKLSRLSDALFNARYDTLPTDEAWVTLQKNQQMNRAGIRDWLNKHGINPYSLSGSLRKLLRMLYQSGEIDKFMTDYKDMYGDDYSNLKLYLEDKLAGGNKLNEFARSKWNKQQAALLELQNPQQPVNQSSPVNDFKKASENFMDDPETKFMGNLNGMNSADRIKAFQEHYNTLNLGSTPLQVDSKFGNNTMSAMKTYAKNQGMSDLESTEWINRVFGNQQFNGKKIQSPTSRWGDMYNFNKQNNYTFVNGGTGGNAGGYYSDHNRGLNIFKDGTVVNRQGRKGTWTYDNRTKLPIIKWDQQNVNSSDQFLKHQDILYQQSLRTGR